jgi:ATP-dependent DNA helicase RecG
MGAVKGLERLIPALCDRLRASGPTGAPAAPFDRLNELKALFSGFDSLGDAAKRERLERAVAIANEVSIAASGAAAGPVPPASPEAVARALGELKRPLERVPGIGPRLASVFGKKGLSTVEDALYYLPSRYEDRRSIRRIRDLTPGASGSAQGTVLHSGVSSYGGRRVFEAVLSDGGAVLKLKWFNYRLPYMKARLKPGARFLVYGPVALYAGRLEMIHPDVEALGDGEGPDAGDAQGAIVPVYPEIQPLHQKTLRRHMAAVAEAYASSAVGGVPDDVLRRLALMPLGEALGRAHLPSASLSGAGAVSMETSLARKSIVFDELFLLELGLDLKREHARAERGLAFGSCRGGARGLEARLRGLIPFTLTRAQERVLSEIRKDMESPHPMNRLIQGDVGSGKTVVSLMAALWAVESGFQAAIMAPTEILAEQHWLIVHGYAEALGVNAALLTGGMAKKVRDKTLKGARSGEIELLIGTHALIQKDVEFQRLGLAVIDEQHRFGVVQRAALRRKGASPGSGPPVSPDVLIMTATPIPRTLGMTVFGDLDVSVIDELPPGRKPVQTRVLRERDRAWAYGAIRKELAAGGQAYIVYPLVEESEELSLRDATRERDRLRKEVFPEFRVGLLHGRMKPYEKESVMREFKARGLDILVSTTVIEVGLDVPDATVMLVEHAERFGLAQLHQLRGRVGRGQRRAICLLMAAWAGSDETYRRLRVMQETTDGFRIAEEDLSIRGPGDILGTRQAGLPEFRTAGALSDLDLLRKAREEAIAFLRRGGLKGMDAARVRGALKARWAGRLELAEIG